MTDSVKTWGGVAVAAIKTYSGIAAAAVNSIGGIAVTGGGSPTYATFDPAAKSARITLSGGDLTATSDGTNNSALVKATVYKSTGKWYCEFTVNSGATGADVGIANSSCATSVYVGETTDGYGYGGASGHKFHASNVAYGATYTNADVISVLFDADAGTLTFWKNGVDQGTAFTGITGAWTPAVDGYGVIAVGYTANFGASAWAYSPPVGYAGWSS